MTELLIYLSALLGGIHRVACFGSPALEQAASSQRAFTR
mgnify:CR=1 FL=1|jgi:hypothetical protein